MIFNNQDMYTSTTNQPADNNYKECRTCKITKTRDEFGLDRYAKDQKNVNCKQCVREYKRNYEKNKRQMKYVEKNISTQMKELNKRIEMTKRLLNSNLSEEDKIYFYGLLK